MTGFGAGSAPLGHGRLVVEVRSLNHRFLELRVRVPAELPEYSSFVEQTCRELLQRGRFDVTVRLEGAALPSPTLDLERGRDAYLRLCALRDEVAPGSEVPLSILGSLAALLTTQVQLEPEVVRAAIASATRDAIQHLDEMRQREGAALQAELLTHLEQAQALRSAISQRLPGLVEQFRQRLRERVDRALRQVDAPALDGARLESEVVLFADRADVTEELARLASHFEQFGSMCKEQVPIGRRLDFLLQEVAREANTIGSKCPDAQLSHLVVELKAEIERIREQVQNVE